MPPKQGRCQNRNSAAFSALPQFCPGFAPLLCWFVLTQYANPLQIPAALDPRSALILLPEQSSQIVMHYFFSGTYTSQR